MLLCTDVGWTMRTIALGSFFTWEDSQEKMLLDSSRVADWCSRKRCADLCLNEKRWKSGVWSKVLLFPLIFLPLHYSSWRDSSWKSRFLTLALIAASEKRNFWKVSSSEKSLRLIFFSLSCYHGSIRLRKLIFKITFSLQKIHWGISAFCNKQLLNAVLS